MRLLSIAFFNIGLLCGCAALAPPPNMYLIDRNTGCKIRNPYVITDMTNKYAVWEGDCYGGFAEGRGTIVYYAQNDVRIAYLRTCLPTANYACAYGSLP